MIYFLYGQNSFLALKKIKEIKSLFLKKNPDFLIDEIDGEEYAEPERVYGTIQNPSLFFGKKLFILKNTLKFLPKFESFLEENINNLKKSQNIFVFWERDIKKGGDVFSLLENHSEKIQETKLNEVPENTGPRNEIFRIADKVFAQKDAKTVLVLQNAMKLGIAPKDLVNVIFWNFKRKQKISKREANLAYEAIVTDMNLKMDAKNEMENMERFTLSISKV